MHIFWRISRKALNARKSDMGENNNNDRMIRINVYVRNNLTTLRLCLIILHARKYSSAKISMIRLQCVCFFDMFICIKVFECISH